MTLYAEAVSRLFELDPGEPGADGSMIRHRNRRLTKP